MKRIKMLEELTVEESSLIYGGMGASSDCSCYCNCHCSCSCVDEDTTESTKEAETDWTMASLMQEVVESNSAQ